MQKEINSLLSLALKRYSCRAYTGEQVSEEDLSYILQCAQLAPSAVNRQPWKFYVCQSAEALDKLQQCYDREWFKTAPTVIVTCIRHDEEWIRQSDGKAHGTVDIAIATEHICLAATERGLGSCWVCNFDTALCQQLLHLPEEEEPAVLIPLGRPKTDEIPEKTRKAIDQIVTII